MLEGGLWGDAGWAVLELLTFSQDDLKETFWLSLTSHSGGILVMKSWVGNDGRDKWRLLTEWREKCDLSLVISIQQSRVPLSLSHQMRIQNWNIRRLSKPLIRMMLEFFPSHLQRSSWPVAPVLLVMALLHIFHLPFIVNGSLKIGNIDCWYNENSN